MCFDPGPASRAKAMPPDAFLPTLPDAGEGLLIAARAVPGLALPYGFMVSKTA